MRQIAGHQERGQGGWRLPLAVLLLPVVLAGCMPLPHNDQMFPAIRGRVIHSGQSVAGARIFATAAPEGEECQGSEFVGSTDEEGIFSVEPEKDFKLFMFFGDPLSAWTLCIEHQGVRYVGWANRSLGHAPKTVRMECDLNDLVTEQSGGKGLCSWAEE